MTIKRVLEEFIAFCMAEESKSSMKAREKKQELYRRAERAGEFRKSCEGVTMCNTGYQFVELAGEVC